MVIHNILGDLMKVAFAIIGFFFFAIAAVIFLGIAAHAGTTLNASGSITAGNTYQQVFAATPVRNGCMIQNNSASAMWVFIGPIASATRDTSYQLPASSLVPFTCSGPSGVQSDQISIDGTTAAKFFANQW